MAGVKILFDFHDNKGGFSDNWIDPAGVFTSYPVTKLVTYLTARMAISGQQTVWDYIRITDFTPNNTNARHVQVYAAGDNDLANAPANGTYTQSRNAVLQNSDFAGSRLLIRRQAVNLSFSNMFFAGYPDNQVDFGGQYTPTGQFPKLLNDFFDAVSGLGWGWASYTTPVPGSVATLTNMVTQTDGTAIITATAIGVNPPIFPNPPYSVNQHTVVRISHQNSPKNANGSFTVVVLTPLTCRTVKPLSINNFVVGNGQIAAKKTLSIPAFVTGKVLRVVKRGPGRPYGLYHGRRAAIARG